MQRTSSSVRPVQAAIIALLLTFIAPTYADVLHVAVASNFTIPMKQLAPAFERRTGHQLRLSFASSGKLYAQIRHGAPFQAFLSADQDKPRRLIDDGLADAGHLFTYASGSLALWSADPDLIKDAGVIKSGAFNKIALANPRLAPYGLAARQTLEKLDLISQSRKHWVQGENIAQTYQFVLSGNAQLGFVALSQIMKENKITTGSAWIVPDELYQPVLQDAVLLSGGINNQAALSFFQFLRSAEAGTIIQTYGYKTLSQ